MTLSIAASAQNFYNTPGTTVSISTNGIISVKDNLINEGKLINNGNMIVGSTWRNLGEYDAGNGKITFNGDAGVPQIINHNNQSINRLEISGGGEKLILANMTIVGELILADGIIIHENDAHVLFEEGAVITGGSDAAHIHAPVYQQGTGTKIFPVGDGTTYLPVEINGITTNSEIGITLTEVTSGQSLTKSSSLADVSDKRYWAVDVVSGSLTNTRIVLPVEGDEGLDPLKENEYVVAFSESISEDFTSLGRNQASTSSRVQSELAPGTGLVSVGILSENLSIVVFNAISPEMKDGLNDYIHIDNLVAGDVVSIYNRWGDLVFEMKNYDNTDASKRFNGQTNVNGGKDLPTGNYFYVIRRKAGKEVTGYISLRK